MSAPLPPDFDLGEPDDDELLSDWERNFLASSDAWEGELTFRQQAKAASIVACMARAGR